jgi:endonuclease/exonuclease/phosphatase family metal-dependent hydrolase
LQSSGAQAKDAQWLTMLTLRLATFNLEHLDYSPQCEEAFAKRRAVLQPLLNKLDFDIVCLQEVNGQKSHKHSPRNLEALDHLLARTRYKNFFVATSQHPKTNAPADIHNLVILSRWPIEEHQQIYHTLLPQWEWRPPSDNGVYQPAITIKWDRPSLYARISLPNGLPLHIINSHLRAPRPVPMITARGLGSNRSWILGQFIATMKREGQALETRLFCETLFDQNPQALIAICGDFNADLYDAPLQLLRGQKNEPKTSQRELVSLEARVKAGPAYSVIHAGKPKLLDHILTSQALTTAWRKTSIYNQGLEDEAFAHDPIIGSLHAPIVTQFRLE